MFNNVRNITSFKGTLIYAIEALFNSMALPISFQIRISSLYFQMDLQAIRLSSLEQVRIFPLSSILLQCAAFPYCLSSGCKGSPASWLVRTTAQIALNRPQSHRCCFPTPFVSELRPNSKL